MLLGPFRLAREIPKSVCTIVSIEEMCSVPERYLDFAAHRNNVAPKLPSAAGKTRVSALSIWLVSQMKIDVGLVTMSFPQVSDSSR